MRAVFALVLVIGMALAGGAVHLAQSYIGAQESQLAQATELQRRTGNLVRVYAAKSAMAFGAPLTPEDVQPIYVQERFLPPGAFLVAMGERKEASEAALAIAASELLFPEDTNKPRMLSRSLEANEIVLASRVTAPGEAASLTDKLGKNMRAFQIRVDVASGVANIIMPESYIDIYWTGSSGSSVSGEVTRLIESAIRVIATDNSDGQGQAISGNARTLTVEASPEQVARLAQAQATGRLSMSLVASAEDVVQGLVEVDRDRLLGVVHEEVVPVDAPQVCSIRTRKGDEVIEVPIPCTN
ncbi:Flp pilus assembly protein CpaB [Pseudogemmobacter sonorensis]|uniref:Flp pilus assembly protein CpaB n=1 Tax=Pseudogemmobacter sonorensis TaxID=2989681 RepID=UPI0036BD201C